VHGTIPVIVFIVVPDLQSTVKEKKGGDVPVKAVDWAIQHCYKYLRAKNHEDLDKVCYLLHMCDDVIHVIVFTSGNDICSQLMHTMSDDVIVSCFVHVIPTHKSGVLRTILAKLREKR